VDRALQKLGQVGYEELSGYNPRLLFARLLTAPLPPYVGGRLRAAVLRLAGFRLEKGVFFCDMPTFIGGPGMFKRLTVGRASWFNIQCFLDLNASITIGEHVAVGPQAMLITSTHRIGGAQSRAGEMYAEPVVIGDGVWIGARSVILPGVTIGSGSIVAAGAVVTRPVDENCVVAGSPARVIRRLDDDECRDSNRAGG